MQQCNSRKGSLIKQIYLSLIGNQPKVAWKCCVFKNGASPKERFIMWLMFHRKLETTDRLTKWGLNVSMLCVFCQSKEESIEHQFVRCPFSIFMWNRLLTWVQQQAFSSLDCSQFLQWIIKHGKGKSPQAQILKIILAECVYGLWIGRNNRVFL